jgi:retron-type reverse transcriptase
MTWSWLRLAHDPVAQSVGSVTAGCDGIDMEIYHKNLEKNLKELSEELKTQPFEPLPVRRVYIPKARWSRASSRHTSPTR